MNFIFYIYIYIKSPQTTLYSHKPPTLCLRAPFVRKHKGDSYFKFVYFPAQTRCRFKFSFTFRSISRNSPHKVLLLFCSASNSYHLSLLWTPCNRNYFMTRPLEDIGTRCLGIDNVRSSPKLVGRDGLQLDEFCPLDGTLCLRGLCWRKITSLPAGPILGAGR